MSALQAKIDATEERIAAHDMPQGGWSMAARSEALARLRSMGLPSRRDEYWKYTRPDTLTQVGATNAAVLATDEAPVFGEIDTLQIVFVDGVFDEAASADLTLEGITIERLAAANADIHWAKGLYGALKPTAKRQWNVRSQHSTRPLRQTAFCCI